MVLVTWMMVAAELLALGGCVSTLHPLYDKESLQFDRALVGAWSSDGKTLTIEPAGDRAYAVTIQQDGQKSTYVAHLTRLGESSFADLHLEDEVLQTLFEGEYYPLLARVHLICRVQLDGELLRIAPLDAEWLQEEIASGKTRLPHERTKDGLILTASTGELRQFLSGRSDRFDEAFSEVTTWRRWPAPVRQSSLTAEAVSKEREAANPAQATSSESKPPRDSFVELFAEEYNVTTFLSATESKTDMKTDRLESFSSYSFKGKKPLPGSNIYPRFRLRVYQYTDVESAAQAQAQFIALVKSSLFYKSPLQLLRDGQTLYLLEGECYFSEATWKDIEQKLIRSVFEEGEETSSKPFRIACGGAITG